MGKDAPEGGSLDNHIYLLKLADIFPIDYSLDIESPDFSKRLRPEYIQAYDKPLSPDCFINIHNSSTLHDSEIIEASDKLKDNQLLKLVQELDNVSIIIADSQSLTEFFHSFGINMRYLGLVAKKSVISYIKSMIYVEIVARTCKNLFFQHISEFLVNFANEDDDDKEKNDIEIEVEPYQRKFSFFGNQGELNKRNTYASKRNRSETRYGTKVFQLPTLSVGAKSFDSALQSTDIYIENSLSECIIDYFNLVFGEDEESSIF